MAYRHRRLKSLCRRTVVFSDKTLMEIARARPQSPDDLLEVSGVGPGKLEKYGGAVLKIMGGGIGGNLTPRQAVTLSLCEERV